MNYDLIVEKWFDALCNALKNKKVGCLMDSNYVVSYVIFNRKEFNSVQKEFDTLTEAIAHVNEIANSNKYRYEHIYIKWGDSRILELYGD